jgi:hypothetical protein
VPVNTDDLSAVIQTTIQRLLVTPLEEASTFLSSGPRIFDTAAPISIPRLTASTALETRPLAAGRIRGRRNTRNASPRAEGHPAVASGAGSGRGRAAMAQPVVSRASLSTRWIGSPCPCGRSAR